MSQLRNDNQLFFSTFYKAQIKRLINAPIWLCKLILNIMEKSITASKEIEAQLADLAADTDCCEPLLSNDTLFFEI